TTLLSFGGSDAERGEGQDREGPLATVEEERRAEDQVERDEGERPEAQRGRDGSAPRAGARAPHDGREHERAPEDGADDPPGPRHSTTRREVHRGPRTVALDHRPRRRQVPLEEVRGELDPARQDIARMLGQDEAQLVVPVEPAYPPEGRGARVDARLE